MARRYRYKPKRYYRTRFKKYYSRSRGGGGSFKPIIDGFIAGAGANLIKRFINIPYADDIVVLGVGYFRKNDTLKTIGAMGLSGDLLGGFGGGSGNGGYIV